MQKRRHCYVTMEPIERVGLTWPHLLHCTPHPSPSTLSTIPTSHSSTLPLFTLPLFTLTLSSLIPPLHPHTLTYPTPPPPYPHLPPHPHSPHPPSGLLTGKFKRDAQPLAPDSSRVAWVEEDKEHRRNQSHPSLSDHINNPAYWNLIDAMRDIATAHGKHVTPPLPPMVSM